MPKPRRLDETLRLKVDNSSTYRTVRTGLETGSAVVKRWHTAPITPGSRLRVRRPHSWLLDYASRGRFACSDPVTIHRTGYPLSKGAKSVHTGGMGVNEATLIEMQVPCRVCDMCLRRRAAHWRFRAMAETKASARTWFGTLTLSPDQHVRVGAACRLVASRNGDDFDAFAPEKQFLARHRCISREITLYLKRLRKHIGAEAFNFLCVAEAHKSGLPHYHILIHERSPSLPVRHKVLTEQWRVGFSNFKLVEDPLHVGYVTKYLSKSMLARVRASIDYGNTSLDIVSN